MFGNVLAPNIFGFSTLKVLWLSSTGLCIPLNVEPTLPLHDFDNLSNDKAVEGVLDSKVSHINHPQSIFGKAGESKDVRNEFSREL